MTILHPQGLESSACECYQVLKQEFDRLRELATLLKNPLSKSVQTNLPKYH
jgi:hypothetical protein